MDPEVLEALRRKSHIHLDADGRFHWGTQLVPNPRVQALFHRGLELRADGEVVLQVGRMWCYVTAAGLVRFVDGFSLTDGALVARLRDGTHHSAPRLAVAAGDGGSWRFYVWPDDGGPALVARSAHGQLAGWLEPDPTAPEGRLVLPQPAGALQVAPLAEPPSRQTHWPTQASQSSPA